MGSTLEEGRERSYTRKEKLGYDIVSVKALANPTGSSKPVRPFGAVLSKAEGPDILPPYWMLPAMGGEYDLR